MSLESRRTALQADLESIPGIKKVYFQPPSSVTMQYPCIVYSFDDIRNEKASNKDYLERDKYTVTLITKDPFPSEMLSLIRDMPYSSFDRQYSSDNIHHFVYTIHLQERT
jgi:hypothetical protein